MKDKLQSQWESYRSNEFIKGVYEKTSYRIIDGEITDPKDVWGIGEIRNPKRLIVLPENN